MNDLFGGRRLGRLDGEPPLRLSRASAFGWYAQHFHVDAARAESELAGDRCFPLTVGDAGEDALACEAIEPYVSMRVHAVVLVVRKKRLVAVLDAGLGMRSLDWLDARDLDLTLAFEPGGRAAVLRERAPEGTLLVESRSDCRAREAFFDACEDALAKGVAADPACSIVTDPKSGEKHVLRVLATAIGDGKAELHGCASARAGTKEAVEATKGTKGFVADDTRGARAFVERTCSSLGRYVWKVDRFVRSP